MLIVLKNELNSSAYRVLTFLSGHAEGLERKKRLRREEINLAGTLCLSSTGCQALKLVTSVWLHIRTSAKL